MIFSEVKNIIVSQGDIKKINLTDGTILYEYVESLVCNPVVGISLSRHTTSDEFSVIRVVYTISGISNSLITSCGVVWILKARLGSKTLTIDTPGRSIVHSSPGTNSDTVNGIEKSYNLRYNTTKSKYAIRAYVTYKDLSGSTVTTYSNQVEASYDSLA